jgi:hypothetical protein
LTESLRFCSVANFLGRHFGHEVVDYLVDPFVAGTSGADPDSISVGLSPVLLFGHVWLILLRLNHHSSHTTSGKSIVVVYNQCRK